MLASNQLEVTEVPANPLPPLEGTVLDMLLPPLPWPLPEDMVPVLLLEPVIKIQVSFSHPYPINCTT